MDPEQLLGRLSRLVGFNSGENLIIAPSDWPRCRSRSIVRSSRGDVSPTRGQKEHSSEPRRGLLIYQYLRHPFPLHLVYITRTISASFIKISDRVCSPEPRDSPCFGGEYGDLFA